MELARERENVPPVPVFNEQSRQRVPFAACDAVGDGGEEVARDVGGVGVLGRDEAGVQGWQLGLRRVWEDHGVN